MINIALIKDLITTWKEVRKGKQRLPQYLHDFAYTREVLKSASDTELLNAYKSWVYIAASKNAATVSSFDLKLYVAKSSKSAKLLVKSRPITTKTREYLYAKNMGHLKPYLNKAVEVEEILEHPFLTLMKNVNPFQNEFELTELTDIHEELTGNAYWFIIKNNAGIPAQIWILYPDRVRVVPDKENFIKGYLYKNYGLGNDVPLETDEVIHFKFPSSNNPYYGMGCLSAVTSAYNINDNMSNYENALFSNMARPDGILKTEQELNEDDFERVNEAWKQTYGGVTNTGKTALLDKGLEYQQISIPPRELSFLMGRKVTKEEIYNAFGVPLGLVSEESNRANSEMATYTYMRDTISPRHRRMEQKLNEKLLPMFDDRLFCAFEDCVPENEQFNHQKRLDNVNAGIISRNEAREEEGIETREELDDIYISNMLVPIGTVTEYQTELLSQKIIKRVKEKLHGRY